MTTPKVLASGLVGLPVWWALRDDGSLEVSVDLAELPSDADEIQVALGDINDDSADVIETDLLPADLRAMLSAVVTVNMAAVNVIITNPPERDS